MLLVNHFSFAECDQIKRTFLQGRHTDGQKAHENMLNITKY